MEVRKTEPIKFKSNPLIWPTLTWSTIKIVKEEPDHYRYSRSWDGHAECWRVPPLKPRILLENKPKLWWCTEDRIWKCQLGLVQTRGTTKRWAFEQLKGVVHERHTFL